MYIDCCQIVVNDFELIYQCECRFSILKFEVLSLRFPLFLRDILVHDERDFALISLSNSPSKFRGFAKSHSSPHGQKGSFL